MPASGLGDSSLWQTLAWWNFKAIAGSSHCCNLQRASCIHVAACSFRLLAKAFSDSPLPWPSKTSFSRTRASALSWHRCRGPSRNSTSCFESSSATRACRKSFCSNSASVQLLLRAFKTVKTAAHLAPEQVYNSDHHPEMTLLWPLTTSSGHATWVLNPQISTAAALASWTCQAMVSQVQSLQLATLSYGAVKTPPPDLVDQLRRQVWARPRVVQVLTLPLPAMLYLSTE